MLEELLFADTESSHVAFLTNHARCLDVIGGDSRSTGVVQRHPNPTGHLLLFYVYADTCDHEFAAEPDRITVDDKQI